MESKKVAKDKAMARIGIGESIRILLLLMTNLVVMVHLSVLLFKDTTTLVFVDDAVPVYSLNFLRLFHHHHRHHQS